MISPYEIKDRQHNQSYNDPFELKIDKGLTFRYDPRKNRVHCDLALGCLTTYSITTLFKYIDAGYDVMISNESNENNDITLTIYHYFNNRDN